MFSRGLNRSVSEIGSSSSLSSLVSFRKDLMSKRACDPCHLRRTKCAGETRPCLSCIKAGLECTDTRVARKKGPAGKVLSRLQQARKPVGSNGESYGTHSDGERESVWTSVGPTFFDFAAISDVTHPGPGESSGGPGATWAESLASMGLQEMLDATAHEMGTHRDRAASSPATFASSSNPHLQGYNIGPSGSSSFPLPQDPFRGGSSITSASPLSNHAPLPSLHSAPPTPLPLPRPQAFLNWVGLITETILRPQIEIFFERVQPVLPVFTRSYLIDRLDSNEHLTNAAFAALLLALASFTLIQPLQGDEGTSIDKRAHQATIFMDEASKLRASSDLGQAPVLDDVLTSFLLFASLFGLQRQNAAWFRLREALILGESLELHRPLSYIGLNALDSGMRLRTYWILAVTERAYSLQRNHSIVFRGKPALSMLAMGTPQLGLGSVGEAGSDPGLVGLQQLARLFDFIDEDIVACWNGHCPRPAECKTMSVDRTINLHRDLAAPAFWGGDDATDSMHSLSNNPQKADLLVTQQWLRNRILQLSIAHCLMNELSPYPELRPSYAFTIAADTLNACRQFTKEALEVNGIGLAEKLQDIALTVVIIISLSQAEFAIGRPLVSQLIVILSQFRGGLHPFLQPVLDSYGNLHDGPQHG